MPSSWLERHTTNSVNHRVTFAQQILRVWRHRPVFFEQNMRVSTGNIVVKFHVKYSCVFGSGVKLRRKALGITRDSMSPDFPGADSGHPQRRSSMNIGMP